MYENIKGHPAFLAFTAAPSSDYKAPETPTEKSVSLEADLTDRKNETLAE